jgi:hypothetical protein
MPFAFEGLSEPQRKRGRVSLGKMADLRAQGKIKPSVAQVRREGEGSGGTAGSRSGKKAKKSKSDAPAVLSTKVPLSRKRVGENSATE